MRNTENISEQTPLGDRLRKKEESRKSTMEAFFDSEINKDIYPVQDKTVNLPPVIKNKVKIGRPTARIGQEDYKRLAVDVPESFKVELDVFLARNKKEYITFSNMIYQLLKEKLQEK